MVIDDVDDALPAPNFVIEVPAILAREDDRDTLWVMPQVDLI